MVPKNHKIWGTENMFDADEGSQISRDSFAAAMRGYELFTSENRSWDLEADQPFKLEDRAHCPLAFLHGTFEQGLDARGWTFAEARYYGLLLQEPLGSWEHLNNAWNYLRRSRRLARYGFQESRAA